MTKQAVRIVTIDDDPDDQEILRRILEDIPEWQVDYRAFLDPHEAIAALREEDADLIFLDYRLGEWTGLAVLQNLRATGIHSPVIFLTGQGDEQVAVEAMHAGAADYMVKHALSINSLRRASATALKRAELERSLREHRENLERTNADLAQRNEAMRSFHHVLSHELRNPAGAALASAQMLLDDPNAGTTAEQREFLEIIESSCQQLLVQIQDLLDLSRMETGKLSVRPQQADLGRVVRQAVVAMGGRAAEQGITLSCSVAEELPSVNVDRDRIAQVINNLLGNALKFTPAGGSVQVRVTCAATENAVRVEVEDSGRGIPADKVDKVFDRLYQVDETDRRDKGGLGLGLNLCQELVELHGGRIGVESTWGVGSRFWFVLPLMGSERPVA